MSRTFQSLLRADDVYVDVEVGSKKHALQLLSQRLSEAAADVTADAVFDGLVERERWGCTAAEGGVAVPHARLDATERPLAVLLRLAEPIDFDGPQAEMVDILFGFIVPESATPSDAEDLKELTERVLDGSLVRTLRDAPDGRAIYAALQQDDGRAAHQAAESG